MIEVMAKIWLWVERLRRQVAQFFYYQNFKKKHISFGWVNGSLTITSVNHTDMVVSIREKIKKLGRVKKRKEFIRLALEEALGGCNFIIFSTIGDSNKFVQFWTGEDQLKYNFYANDVNKLKNNFLSIIGLLSEMGFVNDSITEYRGRTTFKIDKNTNYISVDANFRKDIALATEFTDIIFKQIYKSKSDKLIAKVE